MPRPGAAPNHRHCTGRKGRSERYFVGFSPHFSQSPRNAQLGHRGIGQESFGRRGPSFAPFGRSTAALAGSRLPVWVGIGSPEWPLIPAKPAGFGWIGKNPVHAGDK